MTDGPVAVRFAAERYRTDQPGITTWHCFSSGSHYDPDNVGFGPLIACDEHVLAAGAGFPMHRHAGVAIVSWPLTGELAHRAEDGAVTAVQPGTAQTLHAGAGVAHSESAGADEPVRFLQIVLLADPADPVGYASVAVDVARPRREAVAAIAEIATPDGTAAVSVVRATPSVIRWDAGTNRFAFVLAGSATVTIRTDEFLAEDAVQLSSGDSVQIGATAEAELSAQPGPAELLVVTLP